MSLVDRKDMDMSAIEQHLQTHFVPDDASVVVEVLADAMLDSIDVLMTDDVDPDAPYKAVECWTAQLKRYPTLEKDAELIEMLDDMFLYLSIEAGVRDMEGFDPTQFL